MESMHDKGYNNGRNFSEGGYVGGFFDERDPNAGSSVRQPQRQYGNDRVIPVNCEEAMSITTVSDLHSYSQGHIVRFPDFAEGQPFVARVRRPSMLVLAKSGKIPNALLHTASQLFAKGGGALDADDKNMLSDFYDTCKIICEAALIQPTLAEIESAGMTLSDDQLMAIFNYTQTGVKALQSFRKE